jgi:hypothetical protein
MDWVDVILWVLAIINVMIAAYYDLFKDDDVRTIKHEVFAIAMIVFYIGGQV